jgi:hypothetical protein
MVLDPLVAKSVMQNRMFLRKCARWSMVVRLIAVVCLAYTVQMHLGQRVSTDPVGRQRRAQWTVTDRVSWFWCGQRLFDAPG